MSAILYLVLKFLQVVVPEHQYIRLFKFINTHTVQKNKTNAHTRQDKKDEDIQIKVIADPMMVLHEELEDHYNSSCREHECLGQISQQFIRKLSSYCTQNELFMSMAIKTGFDKEKVFNPGTVHE